MTTTTNKTPGGPPSAATSAAPLPVLDICNNLITVTAYLSAIQSARLPDAVIASNPGLATDYVNWQTNIWQQFFVSLMNIGILTEAEEVNAFVNDSITDQQVYQDVFSETSNPVPTVISLCDDMLDQITLGNNYVAQLESIADAIKDADKEKIAQLDKIIATLNAQFNALEQKLTDTAIDNSRQAVVTVINVSVAVAGEQNPIAPLAKGIAQVGFDVVTELMVSSEMTATLAQLETAWNDLDIVTLQLTKIKLVLKQLHAVISDASETVTALNNIVNDWQTICNATGATAADWTATCYPQLAEWAARMVRVQFYGSVTQTV